MKNLAKTYRELIILFFSKEIIREEGNNSLKTKKCFTTGCKESQFYSQPFGQAVASMYYPTSHFKTFFD